MACMYMGHEFPVDTEPIPHWFNIVCWWFYVYTFPHNVLIDCNCVNLMLKYYSETLCLKVVTYTEHYSALLNWKQHLKIYNTNGSQFFQIWSVSMQLIMVSAPKSTYPSRFLSAWTSPPLPALKLVRTQLINNIQKRISKLGRARSFVMCQLTLKVPPPLYW